MKRLLVAPLLALSITALAQVSVKDPWVRATVPIQKSTGAFMQLVSAGDAQLIEVRSPVADSVEIHQMAMNNNVMKMRPIPYLALPAGKTVELKPGGYHVMLNGLHQQVKEGDLIPLTLIVENAEKKREVIEVKAVVRPLSDAGTKAHQ
ncbi:MAG TPA: copper chaperone PCu(A)C [Noviherbaspirillum sp.]